MANTELQKPSISVWKTKDSQWAQTKRSPQNTIGINPRHRLGLKSASCKHSWSMASERCRRHAVSCYHSTDRHGCSKSLPAAESYLSSPIQQNRGSLSPPLFLSAHNVFESPHRLVQWQRHDVENPQKVAFCVSAPTGKHLSVVPSET